VATRLSSFYVTGFTVSLLGRSKKSFVRSELSGFNPIIGWSEYFDCLNMSYSVTRICICTEDWHIIITIIIIIKIWPLIKNSWILVCLCVLVHIYSLMIRFTWFIVTMLQDPSKYFLISIWTSTRSIINMVIWVSSFYIPQGIINHYPPPGRSCVWCRWDREPPGGKDSSFPFISAYLQPHSKATRTQHLAHIIQI
jgi:hypothetical protein